MVRSEINFRHYQVFSLSLSLLLKVAIYFLCENFRQKVNQIVSGGYLWKNFCSNSRTKTNKLMRRWRCVFGGGSHS